MTKWEWCVRKRRAAAVPQKAVARLQRAESKSKARPFDSGLSPSAQGDTFLDFIHGKSRRHGRSFVGGGGSAAREYAVPDADGVGEDEDDEQDEESGD